MEGVEDLLPTTPAQSGMLFETLARPEGGVNLGLVTAVLPADLDVARYRAAWAKCIARHQSLCSHFL